MAVQGGDAFLLIWFSCVFVGFFSASLMQYPLM